MQIKIKKHASRVEEAVSLCHVNASHHGYEGLKRRILEKYTFEAFDVEKILDRRIQLNQEFLERFKDKEQIIDHYFKHRSMGLYLANILTKLPYFQTEKRKCRYVYDEEVNRSQAFMLAFLEMELIDETYNQQVNNFEDLCLLLEKIDIDREDKWLIQTTYLHLEEEMKQFALLINQIVEWLANYEELICEEELAFCKYWEEVSKRVNFAEELSQKFNIDISKKTSTIWLVPSFFNCHSLYTKKQKDTLYVYIGMIFDDSFSFEKKYETPDLLCSQLKLLSDPSKFEILCTIKNKSYYGSELAKKFDLSTPTISHHMRTLENAGFIKIEKKDNKTYYSLDSERLTLFLKQVNHMLLVKEDE